MKKLILIALVLFSLTGYAQDSLTAGNPFKLDTTLVKFSWYARTMPYAIYTGYGHQVDRISRNIEVGRSFEAIDVGLCYGKISERPDSTNFLEGKLTLDGCQLGIVSSELTLGFGHVFNSKTPVMLEIATTIFVQLGRNWGLGVVTGYYDFSGNDYATSKNYFGVYARFGLLRNENGVLLNRKGNHHHHNHH